MAKKIPFAQSKHKTDVVAYLTLVGWLIAYFCGNRAASRFHLNQALSILLADLGLNAVFMMATFADTAVASVLVRGVCRTAELLRGGTLGHRPGARRQGK